MLPLQPKFIFGLGNPGRDYRFTRHNAGFLLLDYLQQELNWPQFSYHKKLTAQISSHAGLILAKPQTMMNLSGPAVKKTLAYFSELDIDNIPSEFWQQLFVAHDDLDLSIGQYKIQRGVGPKQHNGLLSIYESLAVRDFWHIRLGIDDRHGGRSIPPDKYVLQKLPSDQRQQLQLTFLKIRQQLNLEKVG